MISRVNFFAGAVQHGASARALTRFLANRAATTAIEFAILMPIFCWFVFEISQIGIYFYYSASLYNATNNAVRQILVGAAQNQSLTAAQFRANVLCPLLPSNMSCGDVITNIQIAPTYASGSFYNLTNITYTNSNPLGYVMTGLTPPTMNNNSTSFCIGSSGSVVAVEVYYAMPVLGLPWMLSGATNWNGQKVVFITATSVFKNEPFLTSYSGC
jgi:Flp pilus assembly protein TadG